MRNVLRSSLSQPIKDSLEASWKEGVAAQVMIGIFDYYLIPYALFLGGSLSAIGLLVALPNILSSLSQLFATHAVYWAGNRRKVLVAGAAVQAVMLLPVAFLPWLEEPMQVRALIALVCVFRVLGSLLGPAWGSLISDYLPEGQRGQYLGWRFRVVGIAGLVSLGAWGLLLYFLENKASERAGFVALFLAAALFRFVSLYYMTRMAEVPVHRTPDSDFTLWMFLRRFRESNFVKFIFYTSGVTFAAQLAIPYFSVHMLKNLDFNYLEYMAVNLASVAAGLAAFPAWGRHADKVGTARVLKSTGWLIPLPPLLWIFFRGPWSLTAVELFSGFVWSGFNLAAANFIYDAVSAPKRVRCLAYFNLFNGVAAFGGAWLGGVMAERLPPLWGHPLLSLFLLSALLRFAADFLLSGSFKEVRSSAERVSSMRLFMSVIGFRPLTGQGSDLEIFPTVRPAREPLEPPEEKTALL